MSKLIYLSNICTVTKRRYSVLKYIYENGLCDMPEPVDKHISLTGGVRELWDEEEIKDWCENVQIPSKIEQITHPKVKNWNPKLFGGNYFVKRA